MTRILVVEDEESYREPLTYQLTREGFEVVAVATGLEALAAFDEGERTSSCWTSCSPGCPAPRCAGSCASGRTCRSSCSRRRTARSTRSSGSSSVRTTT